MISQETCSFDIGMFEVHIYYHLYPFIKDINEYSIFNSL